MKLMGLCQKQLSFIHSAIAGIVRAGEAQVARPWPDHFFALNFIKCESAGYVLLLSSSPENLQNNHHSAVQNVRICKI